MKKITLYESDSEALKHGRIYNQATGQAYLDEETGDIDFTDDLGDYAQVTGHGHIDIDQLKMDIPKSSGDVAGDAALFGSLVEIGVKLFCVLLFVMAIPIMWKGIFSDFDEFPEEVMVFILVAIITLFVSIIKGFKVAIITSAVLGTIFEIGLAIYKNDLSFWYFILFPLMCGGFGVPPAAIGAVIKTIYQASRKFSNKHKTMSRYGANVDRENDNFFLEIIWINSTFIIKNML